MHRAVLHPPAILLFSLACSSMAFPQELAGKYWVYFIDKGPSAPASGALRKGSPAFRQALEFIQPRALSRRAKVLPPDELIDAADLPLYHPYIEEVRRIGGTLLKECRWVNAASFLLTPEQRITAGTIPRVRKVSPVVVFRRRIEQPAEENPQVPDSPFSKVTSLNYGPSITQLQFINVPALHSIGITGSGVIVGMLDSGFRWRVHEALMSRTVIAEHDFIFNDDTTADQDADLPGQDAHGTATMSVLGGYMPGQLVGPAFDASFILAKTEDIRSETRIEEDNWAAAMEWMEAQGVDVASSSVGYNLFDDGTGYTWENGDFNGRTSVTAQAAALAARMGVVVCAAMGNERNGNGVVGTLLTPADADSILSVGAVSFEQKLAPFSSTGPTNDGRTKPDVVAPGVGVYHAQIPDFYVSSNGTSFSTPLTAGSVALLLSARPELTPIQVRDALRNTATPVLDNTRFPPSPNNFTGWGLVNAFNAALSFGPIFSNKPALAVLKSKSVVSISIVSKFGVRPERVHLRYALGDDTTFSTVDMSLDSSEFFPTSGRYTTTVPAQVEDTLVQFYIESSDGANNSYRSPAAITGRLWQLHYGVTGVHITPPESYALKQNFPNPFNSSTSIRYDLPRTERVKITVYNFLGEEIETLLDRVQDAGSNLAVTFFGNNLPSGVYFFRITTPSFTSTNKMILIR